MLLALFAKSKKYGGRCIAGIEVIKKGAGYEFVREGGEPHWVRPVSTTEHGEIPLAIVEKLKLLDVVEFSGLEPAPEGFQSENFRLMNLEPRLVGALVRSASVLNQVITTNTGPLFGNRGKAIHADKIDTLSHSLILIAAENSTFHMTKTQAGKPQLRVVFKYHGVPYDLPVTDPEFEQLYASAGSKPPTFSTCYLTLSVGLAYMEFHYKLVAGVFPL